MSLTLTVRCRRYHLTAVGLRNRVMTLASWAWYYLRLDRPIRIILQTPPDPIVSTLRTPDPDKRRV